MTWLSAVLGVDVSRSLSPKIHRAAGRAAGSQVDYLAVSAADAEDFRAKVRALATLGAVGANVTIPYKAAAFDLATVRRPAAIAIGAVNTLTFLQNGGVEGDNTDGPGLLRLLGARDASDLEVVRILGAGGAARAAAWAAQAAGAKRMEVAARRRTAAEDLAAQFGGHGVGLEAGASPTLVISTLPGGDRGLADLAIDRWIDQDRHPCVLDLAYAGPHHPTPLVQAARSSGLSAADGLELLVEQGALSFVRWTGADLEPVRTAMRQALGVEAAPPGASGR